MADIKKNKIISTFVALSLLSIIPQNALASAKKEEKKEGGGVMANPLSVEIPGVVVPISSGRRLVNYAFMTLVVYAADDKSANIIRGNAFLVKDAIIRSTSRNPIPVMRPYNQFNIAYFTKTVTPVVGSCLIGVKVNKIVVENPEMLRR